MVEIVDENVLRLCQCRIIWYQLPGFKTIIVCSVHSIRFVKYVSFAKIWFMKTSTRIVKYESRVVKSNPAQIDCISSTCPMREKWWYLEIFWSVFSLIRTEYRPKKLLNTDTLYTVIKSFIKVSGLEKLPVQQIWKTQRFLRETYVFLTSSVHIWGMQPLLR